jgi:putative Holliday junction resolvase
MRTLALDPGSVRVGVALSDELGLIAQPVEFIPAEPFPALLQRLRQILAEKQVGLIVVGLPRNMDGSYGPAALKVREFVAALRAEVATPIRTWDERLTSVQANRMLTEANVRRDKRKGRVDQMAAAILLQSFLDAQGGGATE